MKRKLKGQKEDSSTAISKKNAWHRINTKLFLVRSWYIILDELGDGILQPLTKNDNDKLKKIQNTYEGS